MRQGGRKVAGRRVFGRWRCGHSKMSRLFGKKPSRRQMLGQAPPDDIIMTTTPYSRALDMTYHLGPSRGVRDAIINLVMHLHGSATFCVPFVEHLQRVGRRCLDGFSELEFLLQEYRVRLVFRTSQMEKNEMTYTLPDLRLAPDERLQERPGLLARLLGARV